MKNVEYKTLLLFRKIAHVLKPTEPMTISQWAEKYMVLPKTDANAGKYSTKNAPYQKEIMDSITNPEIESVAVMSSAQVGKSLIMKCGIGYFIDHEPEPQLIVLPTYDLGERFSKLSLAPMLEDVPRVGNKISDVKAKNSNNTIMLKTYPGGSLTIAGANAPSSLSQISVRVLWMDEVDRFPGSAGTEGNPVLLAKKRTNAYWNKKHILTSTPTIKGHSRIEDAYNKGTMEEWCVACPECGEFQPYSFKRIKFDSVSMCCEKCGILSPEQKWKKSEHKWIAGHPERKKHRSFHLNELASPFKDWDEIIEDFKNAHERLKKYYDSEDLKVFVNTVLGETWDDTQIDEKSIDDNELAKRAEYYEAEIPDGVLAITAAVDVQDNRFEVELRGWARKYESWGLYKTEIFGDLYTEKPWNELESYLDQTLSFQNGNTLNVACVTIDSGGHFTNSVYKWVKDMKKKKSWKCYALKGYANKEDIPLLYGTSVVQIKEERNGKSVVVARTTLNIIGVNSGKEDITNRLKIEEAGEGFCHFPDDQSRGYDAEYYEGLLSEKKVIKQKNGKIKITWVKESGKRNEPFDLFNYNYVAIELLNPNWDNLENAIKKGINYMKPARNRINRRKNQEGIRV